MKRITEETKTSIKRMLLQGFYGYQVAEACGVSEGYVQRIRNELKKEGHNVGYDR